MPDVITINANEPIAARRRAYFHLVGPDGITPANDEDGQQPEASLDGAAWTGAPSIGTLTLIGHGRYYAELTLAAVAFAGTAIETRYKSVNTAECPGDSIRVVHAPARVEFRLPVAFTRPAVGTATVYGRAYLTDAAGQFLIPDGGIALTVANGAGQDRSANLSALDDDAGAGRYDFEYAVDAGHALEQLNFELTASVGGEPRRAAVTMMVVAGQVGSTVNEENRVIVERTVIG